MDKQEFPEVYTIAESCKKLKVGRNTMAGLIHSGQIKAVKAGERRWIIPKWALDAFLGKPEQIQ
jgi:excisionase family DNA binding protein